MPVDDRPTPQQQLRAAIATVTDETQRQALTAAADAIDQQIGAMTTALQTLQTLTTPEAITNVVVVNECGNYAWSDWQYWAIGCLWTNLLT